jgi:adenylate cyclase
MDGRARFRYNRGMDDKQESPSLGERLRPVMDLAGGPVVAVVITLLVGAGTARLGCAGQVEDAVDDRLGSVRAKPRYERVQLVDLGQDFQAGNNYDWDDPAQAQAKCAQFARAIDNAFVHGAKLVVLDKWLGRRAALVDKKSSGDDQGDDKEPEAAQRFTYCTPRTKRDPVYRVIRKHASRVILPVALVSPHKSLASAKGVSKPAPLLAQIPGVRFGLVNLEQTESSIRRVVGCVRIRGDRTYCSLGVEAARLVAGLSPLTAGKDTLRFGDRRVALRAGGLTYAAHRFPKAMPLSFVGMDLANPQLPAVVKTKVGGELKKKLAGKIVFIGPTEPCLCKGDKTVQGDLHLTPFGYMAGVKIHASAMATLLTGLHPASLPGWAAFLLSLLLALAAYHIGRRLSLTLGLVVTAVVLLAGAVLIVWLRGRQTLSVPLVATEVEWFVAFLIGVAMRMQSVGAERLRLWIAFRHYLSPEVIKDLLKNPGALRLGGQRHELTLLFSDIRGFTALSEAAPADVITRFVNDYFTVMTDAVMRHGGYLDKYIGDGIMALYGAPVITDTAREHAVGSCRTAFAMIQALGPLNERWADTMVIEICIGVGLNTGEATVGNMGSSERFNYTAFGDAVNLSARLEGLNKAYGTAVLVTATTQALAAEDFAFREVDQVRVKGREQAERIYELLGPTGHEPDFDLDLYVTALAHYRKGDLAAARESLEKLLADCPSDGPSHVLLKRIEHLSQDGDGLPPDWDGVWTMESK